MDHEDLSMQAYISDVGKITITAVNHNIARHENEG